LHEQNSKEHPLKLEGKKIVSPAKQEQPTSPEHQNQPQDMQELKSLEKQ
jgi:hypothetical protein